MFEQEREFISFINLLDLKHFDAREFLIAVGRRSRNGAINQFPPKQLWPNIAATAIVLDNLRERLGHPIIITSCYRSEEYNADIGGARRSQHKLFTAADIASPSASPVAIFRMLKSMQGETFPVPVQAPHLEYIGNSFIFSGGLGLYKRFVHVDTRGFYATWRKTR